MTRVLLEDGLATTPGNTSEQVIPAAGEEELVRALVDTFDAHEIESPE